MKLMITLFVLVGIVFMSGLGGTAITSMERIHSTNTEEHTFESVIGDIQGAMDSTWTDNLKKADLVTLIKATAGIRE